MLGVASAESGRWLGVEELFCWRPLNANPRQVNGFGRPVVVQGPVAERRDNPTAREVAVGLCGWSRISSRGHITARPRSSDGTAGRTGERDGAGGERVPGPWEPDCSGGQPW